MRRILITGVSGFVGSALAARLAREDGDRFELHGLARDPARVDPGLARALQLHRGDVLSGAGLDAALEGAEVAYYLIHSMEPGAAFAQSERAGAERFAAAAARAGVRRIVYLGGPQPPEGSRSDHLRSRHGVERVLLDAVPGSVALRASIVIGARSRSFRFLVRLVERLPVLALPAWWRFRTQPIDERDVVEYLRGAASEPAVGGLALDIAGPDTLSYGEIVTRIAELMMVRRPALRLPFTLTPVASPVAAAVAGEDLALVGPLMAGLEGDLLLDDAQARRLLPVRLHSFDRAVEHALHEWERREPLRAR
jgi:uncharacterized protein YbjT (DUF2867 family)